MKNGKYENKAVPAHKSASVRSLALLLALVLLLGGVIGGTIAWLADKSDDVVNTFTTSDITIELDETDTDPSTEGEQHSYKMIPGWTITKDPKATVVAGSEDCYLFVKIEKSTNFDQYMTYGIADGWIALDGETGVYYREVANSTENQEFAVLKDNQVKVLDSVTKEMMATAKGSEPTLTFTAYAVQLWKTNKPADGADADQIADAKFGAAAAWAEAKDLE